MSYRELGIVRAQEVRVGDWIMWAGHCCKVTRCETLRRTNWHHDLYVVVDLVVPGLPDVRDAHYQPGEMVMTCVPDQEGEA